MKHLVRTGLSVVGLLLLTSVMLPAMAAEEEKAAESPAPAPPPIPKNRLYLSDLSIIRYNPLGLETQNRLVFQHRLMDSQSVLFRDTFVNGALSLKLNPAYVKVGPTVDLQPIALLHMRLGYEFVKYFGTVGYLRSYDDPTADYADDTRAATESEAYATAGHHIFFEPTLQMKVKKVAVRTKFAFEYWNVTLAGDDTVFYDATLDTLVPAKGMVIANDTDLLYVAGKLTAGLRLASVLPQYSDDNFPTGEPSGFEKPSHMRLGPLVAYSFHTRENSGFNKPTLLAILGWYLNHPNREGGVPYVLVGFSFSSDFLKKS